MPLVCWATESSSDEPVSTMNMKRFPDLSHCVTGSKMLVPVGLPNQEVKVVANCFVPLRLYTSQCLFSRGCGTFSEHEIVALRQLLLTLSFSLASPRRPTTVALLKAERLVAY